jgi:hypothetical protein
VSILDRVNRALPVAAQGPEEVKMRKKRMSRKGKAVAKLFASLGVVGLVIGYCGSRVNAGVAVPAGSFTVANYSGRYVCVASTGPTAASGATAAGFQGEYASAVMKLKPNGSGGYNATSILSANDSAFGGTGSGFCSWTLAAGSLYTISGDGTGFEKLIWAANTPPTGDTGICPGSFTDLRAIALRNLLNINGVSVDAEFASANLFGDTTTHGASAGHGFCLK